MLDRPTTRLTVPLNRLKFGDAMPGGGVNARVGNHDEGLDELKASLHAHGLIQALKVVKGAKDIYFVVDGNRRLAGLHLLAREKRLAEEHPVEVSELGPGINPVEASLAANLLRMPMHEVDQHEAFARLAGDGLDVAEIASHFGTTDLLVRRRLALGRLSPAIRTAWRSGEVSVDIAQAFTIVEDQALQDQTFHALTNSRNVHRGSIIRALAGSEQTWANRRYLALVGQRTFAAAGGRLAEDLFEPEAPKVLDHELLMRLAREAVEVECARLVGEGWAWAAWDQDLPTAHYGWRQVDPPEPVFREAESEARAAFDKLRLRAAGRTEDGAELLLEQRNAAVRELRRLLGGPIGLRSCSPEMRARTGCKLRVDDDGSLAIAFGYVRPEEGGSGRHDPLAEPLETVLPSREAAGTPAGISAALSQSLSELRTRAAAGALAADPALALRLLVATLQSRQSPLRLSARGWPGLDGVHGVRSQTWGRKVPSFVEALALTEGAHQADLLAELAALLAAALDLTDASRDNPGLAVVGQDVLVAALDPQLFLAEARQVFDPEAYFDRVPSKTIGAAIAEMGAAPRTGDKKIELVAQAAALARDKGWLPPQLRCEVYAAS